MNIKCRFPFIIFLSIFVSVLILSCDKEGGSQLVYNNSESIAVFGTDAQSDHNTKTSLDGFSLSWLVGDQIGIFSPEAGTSVGIGGGVENINYIAQTSASSSAFSGGMYWGSGAHSFYAYYPYNSLGGFIQTSVPVTVPTVQTQVGASKSHLSNYDFLIATPITGVSPVAGSEPASVNFSFNHLFTLLEFKITSSSSRNITEVELVGPEGEVLSVSGTVNITLPTPANSVPYAISSINESNSVKVNITGGITCTSENETTPSIFMMINPSDLSGKEITILIKTNSEIVQAVTRTGINFKRGFKYLVNVASDANGASAGFGELKGLFD